MSAAVVDVSDCIDRSTPRTIHWIVFALCGACVILDGFDIQSMGYVAPALIRDWHVPAPALGLVFSSALVGILFGSLFLSALADRIGRRPILIFGTFYFSALTFLTASATSIDQLLAIRFLAGLGLGGIMPSAMTLAGEYSPRKLRIPVMIFVSAGFTAGAAAGGFISAWLIPAYGWRSVFLFGGAMPLAIAALMIPLLPESLPFLALRGNRSALIAKWLGRIDPSAAFTAETRFTAREKSRKGVPAAHLFHEGRTRVTVLLWIVNFMNLLNLYFLSSWVPTVTRDAGYSTSTAVLLGATVQVGGTLGALANAGFIGRFGFAAILSAWFFIGAIAITSIGQPLSLPLLFAATFIAGWSILGGQPGLNALAVVYYPTDLRSTGIGWGLGIGRIGAILGPFIGGQLITLKWTPRDVFRAAAIPALISALAMLGLRSPLMRPLARATAQAPAAPAGPTH